MTNKPKPDAAQAIGSEAMKDGWVDLGLERSFTRSPVRISVGNTPYYLVFHKGDYQLLSAVCPHQGGTVSEVSTGFECPSHGWCFDYQGNCVNAPDERLASFPVSVHKNHIFAQIPHQSSTSAAAPKKIKQLVDCTIQLHSHACLEISHKGFSLLTDPWLAGPAFLGAWMHYPPVTADVSNLRPDAIWISHEHSDHFHEPTLKLLDRSIPIYIPDFPNRRMVEDLAVMGFTAVHPMAFGEPYQVSDAMKITCFEPGSIWNDSIVLIEIGEFRLLNLNDAGLNQRIAAQVAPVHAVASQFSPGASGYPLTWRHLTDTEKIEIMEQGRRGSIEMLREAMDLYGGEYLLPIACHFSLWHPSHREYARLMRKNTVDDVVAAFDQHEVNVIDLLPGESWDVSSGSISRSWDQRDQLYDRDTVLSYLDSNFDATIFEKTHPTSACPERAEVESYFLRLNQVPDIVFCEELTVLTRVQEIDSEVPDLAVSFEVKTGHLTILQDPPESPNLVIEVPGGILKRIVNENLSWDEAHIGYWCRFTRSPDVYHTGFWRLLQAPYFNKPRYLSRSENKPIQGESIVGDLIETYGGRADRIMRRYGLYCASCHHSTWCTVSDSGRVHGVPKPRIDRLVQELSQLST